LFRSQGIENGTSILSKQEDLMVVQLDLTRTTALDPLGESDKIALVTQAPAGGSKYKQFQAPRRIKGGSSYIP